jgi:signal transduction histidine kinase
MVATALRPLGESRSYLALLYAVGRLPVAWAYLVALVVAVGIGISSLFALGIGVVFLLLFLLGVYCAALFERELGVWWFGFQLRPMSAPLAAPANLWRRLLGFLGNPVTWKSLAYYLIQIPAGLIVGMFFLVALAVIAGVVAGPLVYLLDAATFHPGDPAYNAFWLGGPFGGPGLQPLTLGLLVVFAAAGALAFLVLLHAARAYVDFQELFVRTMLGMSPAQLALGEAKAAAETQYRRAEASEQSRRQLIVNVGHELRTPIASIRGHVESLLDARGRPSEEDIRHYLEVVERETERLGALVDDLLAVARADAGELRLDLRPVDVGALAGEVQRTLAPIADRDRKVKVVAQLPVELPPAWADRDRLAQVLMNLVRNSIAYTPEGGIVSIEAVAADGAVEIAVADTGIGIEAAELPRIFDRFYRTDSSRSRATGGFGLGLAISRDLVEAMSGTIEVSSEPGVGSRFTVRLRSAV